MNMTIEPPKTTSKEEKEKIWQRRQTLANENLRFSEDPQRVPRRDWPESFLKLKSPPYEVWRSRKFLIQVFMEKSSVVRISVNRTKLNEHGHYVDDITWDDLQRIKNQIGYAHRDAVEVFPAAEEPDQRRQHAAFVGLSRASGLGLAPAASYRLKESNAFLEPRVRQQQTIRTIETHYLYSGQLTYSAPGLGIF